MNTLAKVFEVEMHCRVRALPSSKKSTLPSIVHTTASGVCAKVTETLKLHIVRIRVLRVLVVWVGLGEVRSGFKIWLNCLVAIEGGRRIKDFSVYLLLWCLLIWVELEKSLV